VDPIEAEFGRRVVGPLLVPQRPAHLERVVEEPTATREVEPGSLVLLALPPDTDAEVEPTAGQDVERRRGLRQHHRSPQGGDQDVGTEAYARRHPGKH